MANTQTTQAPQSKTASKPASSGAQMIRDNAAAAEKCAPGNKKGQCGFCEREGYPILLLRYAVIPTYLPKANVKPLAQVPMLDNFADKPLQHSQYTLRTLRQGFVHVYLGQPGVWQTYVVTADGYLRQLPDPDDPDWKTERPLTEACQRAGHNVPASFITIPEKYKDKTIWIAFAENAWSGKVRARYEKAPGKRMQSCQPSALLANPSTVKHGFEFSSKAKEVVTAKRTSAAQPVPDAAAPSEGGDSGVPLEDFVYDYVASALQYYERYFFRRPEWTALGERKTKESFWKSLHGNHPHIMQSAPLVEFVRQRTAKSKKPGKPAAFVLHDAMGMVKELNGFIHDFVSTRGTYCTTVARPLLISQAIVGLRTQVAQAVAQVVKDQEAKDHLPNEQKTIGRVVGNPNHSVNAIKAKTTTQQERIDAKFKSAWGDMLKRYDEPGRVAFEERYTAQMKSLGESITKCDADWAVWARDKRWKQWFGDYDLEKLHDNVDAMCMCAPALAGGPQGQAGIELWEEWLKKKTDPDSPAGYTQLYAAVVGGREELLNAMFPEDDKDNKDQTKLKRGDKLYDTLAQVLSSDEVDAPEKFRRLMTEQVQQSAAHLIAAMEGAISHLEKKVADEVEPYVRRATQAGLKLYSNTTAIVLQLRMTVGQYMNLLDQVARKGVDEGKHLAEQTGRKARSMLLGGILSIQDKKIRDTVIDVTICTLDNAQEVKRTIEAAIKRAETEIYAVAGQTAAALRITSATISREAMELLKPLEGKLKLVPVMAKALGRDVATRSLRVVGGAAGPLLAVGSLVLQGWALRDARKELNKAFGEKGGWEAKGAVVSATLGVIAASMELAAIGFKMFSVAAAGKFLVKAGGALAAISLIVDGAQAVFSGVRAYRQGDKGAAVFYGAGAVALFTAAAISFGSGFSTALTGGVVIGPLGWVLLLIAAGVLLIWWASNLESTPMEIWLDRCYWGYGKRTEGKWTDAQMQEEITDLNALVLGLGVELTFNDDWSEIATNWDTLKVKLTFPNFDGQESVYTWKVYALRRYSSGEVVMAGGKDAQVMPEFKPMPKGPLEDKSRRMRNRQGTDYYKGGNFVVEESVEVNTLIYDRARVEVKYWPNRNEPDAWAERLVLVAD